MLSEIVAIDSGWPMMKHDARLAAAASLPEQKSLIANLAVLMKPEGESVVIDIKPSLI